MQDLRRTSEITTKKETQLKFHKTIVFYTFLNGSDFWTTKAKDIKLTDPVEITCTGTIRFCTRPDHTKNEDIQKTLKIQLVHNKVDKYRQNWVTTWPKWLPKEYQNQFYSTD
jgi:hypothetical protein